MSQNQQHFHLSETEEEVLAELVRLLARSESLVRYPPLEDPYLLKDIHFDIPPGSSAEAIASIKLKAKQAAHNEIRTLWNASEERKKLIDGQRDLLDRVTKRSWATLWPVPPVDLMTPAEVEIAFAAEAPKGKGKARATVGDPKGKGKAKAADNASTEESRMYELTTSISSLQRTVNLVTHAHSVEMLKSLLVCHSYFRQDQNIFKISTLEKLLLNNPAGGVSHNLR